MGFLRLLNTKILDSGTIRFHTQAGHDGHFGHTVDNVQGLAIHVIAHGIGRAVQFEHRYSDFSAAGLHRGGGQKMQSTGQVELCTPCMGYDVDSVLRRNRANLQGFGGPAAIGQVGLGRMYAALCEQILKPPPCLFAFPCGNGHIDLVRQPAKKPGMLR